MFRAAGMSDGASAYSRRSAGNAGSGSSGIGATDSQDMYPPSAVYADDRERITVMDLASSPQPGSVPHDTSPCAYSTVRTSLPQTSIHEGALCAPVNRGA